MTSSSTRERLGASRPTGLLVGADRLRLAAALARCAVAAARARPEADRTSP